MRLRKVLSLGLALACSVSLLAGCGSAATSGTTQESTAGTATPASTGNAEHEPITICAPSRSVKNLIDVVHEKYPEIVFEVDPYFGPNTTAYLQDQLLTNNQADIYTITYDMASSIDLSDRLVDLSGYSFTGNYVSSRLREVTQDGKIYLLPSYYSCLGITYNKKFLPITAGRFPNPCRSWRNWPPRQRRPDTALH
ncbi:hypothetical protein [Gemmiger sp.]